MTKHKKTVDERRVVLDSVWGVRHSKAGKHGDTAQSGHTYWVHSQEGNKESRILELFGPFLFGLGPSPQDGVAYILDLSFPPQLHLCGNTLRGPEVCPQQFQVHTQSTTISSKVSKITILSYEKRNEQKHNTHTPKAWWKMAREKCTVNVSLWALHPTTAGWHPMSIMFCPPYFEELTKVTHKVFKVV